MNKVKIIMVLIVVLFIGSYFIYDFIYQREGYIATQENKKPVSQYDGGNGSLKEYIDDVQNITNVIQDIENTFENGGILDPNNIGSFN